MIFTIIQWFLVVLFVMAGAMKIMQPYNEFKKKMKWAEEYPDGKLKWIGVAEMAGGLGLVLPIIFGVAEFLVPLAALGLLIVTLLAARLHHRRKETKSMYFASTIAVLCALTLWNFWPFLGLG